MLLSAMFFFLFTILPCAASTTPDQTQTREKRLMCQNGWRSCPVPGIARGRGKTFMQLYECIDVANDLETCGGCVNHESPEGERAPGGGRDCTAIPDVYDVRCEGGECRIGRCADGHYLADHGQRCKPYATTGHTGVGVHHW